MVKKSIYLLVLVLFSTSTAFAAKWKIPVNIAYSHGFWDIYHIMDENMGPSQTTWIMPVGTSIQPYAQLDNNMRIGFGFGPFVLMLTDSDVAGRYFSIPVNFNLGYTFSPESATSAYIRGGLAYHLATGKNVESSTPGALVGFGIEFNRKGEYWYCFEVGYDSSEIEMIRLHYYESIEKIKPASVMVGFGVVF